jgi:hypothetical protein
MGTNAPDPNQPLPPAPAPANQEAPAWATRLQQTLDALPGKLTATITDQDRDSIAEGVHKFFERSGAFHAPDEPPPGEPAKPDPVDNPDGPPAPPGGDKPPEKGDSIARKLMGRW